MANRWKPQTNLRWLALVVLAVAVGLGWYRDHHEAEQRLARLPGDIAVLDGQIDELTARMISPTIPGLPGRWNMTMDLPVNSYGVFDDFPVTAVAYHQTLKEMLAQFPVAPLGSHYNEFFLYAGSVYNAPDGEFAQAIEPLLAYLQDERRGVAESSLRLTHILLAKQPERMQRHLPELVPHLVKCLESPNQDSRLEAIACLRLAGPAAAPALEPLRELLGKDNTPLAVYAAFAVARIDKDADVGERLKELIRERSVQSWTYGAEHLKEVLPPAEVRAFYREEYLRSADEAVYQKMFARLLNDVSFSETTNVEEPQ